MVESRQSKYRLLSSDYRCSEMLRCEYIVPLAHFQDIYIHAIEAGTT